LIVFESFSQSGADALLSAHQEGGLTLTMRATRWVLLYSPFFTGFTSSLISVSFWIVVELLGVSSKVWVLGLSYGLSRIALAVEFLFLPLMTRGMVGWVAR
jgi:hypothetical protein